MKISTFQFLSALAQNNNREWFQENKYFYTEAQQDTVAFIEKLMAEISKFDEKVSRLEAKKTLFRIYRDTRFSKDKTPYKKNFSANLGMGKGSVMAGYYLHVEPGNSFVAGGIYQPVSAALKEIRKEISAFSKEFLEVVENKDFKKYFGQLSQEDHLQRVPVGFDKDHPMAEFLKLKSFIVLYPLKDEELLSAEAPQKIAKLYSAMKPLNDFLNTAFQ